MVGSARVFVLTIGLATASLGVVAAPAQAAAPLSGVDGSDSQSQPEGGSVSSARHKRRRPVVNITPDWNQEVVVGTELTFDGSASFDPDGGTVGYEWRSTGVRKIASTDAAYTRTFDSPGRYAVRLRVIDDQGQRAAKKVWITVVESAAPVVVLTPEKSRAVELGSTVLFDGTGSYDPDGGYWGFEWRVTRPNADESELVSENAMYALTLNEFGGYIVSLTVIDDEGQRTTEDRYFSTYVSDWCPLTCSVIPDD